MIDSVTNSAHPTTPPTARSGPSQTEAARLREGGAERGDALELSSAARQQLEKPTAEGIRTDLVERVRADIAAGTYLTDDKIDAVVDRLLNKIIAAA